MSIMKGDQHVIAVHEREMGIAEDDHQCEAAGCEGDGDIVFHQGTNHVIPFCDESENDAVRALLVAQKQMDMLEEEAENVHREEAIRWLQEWYTSKCERVFQE